MGERYTMVNSTFVPDTDAVLYVAEASSINSGVKKPGSSKNYTQAEFNNTMAVGTYIKIYKEVSLEEGQPATPQKGTDGYYFEDGNFKLSASCGWKLLYNDNSEDLVIWCAEACFKNGEMVSLDGDTPQWTVYRLSGYIGQDGRNGDDGTTYEFIMCTIPTETISYNDSLINPNTEYDPSVEGKTKAELTAGNEEFWQTEYVPTGWSDDPVGIDKVNRYEFYSVRFLEVVGTNENNETLYRWGRFSDPVLRSVYGKDGVDGSTVEYIFARTTQDLGSAESLEAPNDDYFTAAYSTDDYIPHIDASDDLQWRDNPISPTAQYPYVMVSIRKKPTKVENLTEEEKQNYISEGFNVSGDTVTKEDKQVWSKFSKPTIWANYSFSTSNLVLDTTNDNVVVLCNDDYTIYDGDETHPNGLPREVKLIMSKGEALDLSNADVTIKQSSTNEYLISPKHVYEGIQNGSITSLEGTAQIEDGKYTYKFNSDDIDGDYAVLMVMKNPFEYISSDTRINIVDITVSVTADSTVYAAQTSFTISKCKYSMNNGNIFELSVNHNEVVYKKDENPKQSPSTIEVGIIHIGEESETLLTNDDISEYNLTVHAYFYDGKLGNEDELAGEEEISYNAENGKWTISTKRLESFGNYINIQLWSNGKYTQEHENIKLISWGNDGEPGRDGDFTEYIYMYTHDADTQDELLNLLKSFNDKTETTQITQNNTEKQDFIPLYFEKDEHGTYILPSDANFINETTHPYFQSGAGRVITEWFDNPKGVNVWWKYEWGSYRTRRWNEEKKGYAWSEFAEPTLRNAFGERGEDGDGVKYIYCVTSSGLQNEPKFGAPWHVTDKSSGEDTANNVIWYDDIQATDKTNKYLYVSVNTNKIKVIDGTTEYYAYDDESWSKPSLWSTYVEPLYKIGITNDTHNVILNGDIVDWDNEQAKDISGMDCNSKIMLYFGNDNVTVELHNGINNGGDDKFQQSESAVTTPTKSINIADKEENSDYSIAISSNDEQYSFKFWWDDNSKVFMLKSITAGKQSVTVTVSITYKGVRIEDTINVIQANGFENAQGVVSYFYLWTSGEQWAKNPNGEFGTIILAAPARYHSERNTQVVNSLSYLDWSEEGDVDIIVNNGSGDIDKAGCFADRGDTNTVWRIYATKKKYAIGSSISKRDIEDKSLFLVNNGELTPNIADDLGLFTEDNRQLYLLLVYMGQIGGDGKTLELNYEETFIYDIESIQVTDIISGENSYAIDIVANRTLVVCDEDGNPIDKRPINISVITQDVTYSESVISYYIKDGDNIIDSKTVTENQKADEFKIDVTKFPEYSIINVTAWGSVTRNGETIDTFDSIDIQPIKEGIQGKGASFINLTCSLVFVQCDSNGDVIGDNKKIELSWRAQEASDITITSDNGKTINYAEGETSTTIDVTDLFKLTEEDKISFDDSGIQTVKITATATSTNYAETTLTDSVTIQAIQMKDVVSIGGVKTFFGISNSDVLNFSEEDYVEEIKKRFKENSTSLSYNDVNWSKEQPKALEKNQYLFGFDITLGDNEEVIAVSLPYYISRYIVDGTTGGTLYKRFDTYACVSDAKNPRYNEGDEKDGKYYAPYKFQWKENNGIGGTKDVSTEDVYPNLFEIPSTWTGEFEIINVVNHHNGITYSDNQQWRSFNPNIDGTGNNNNTLIAATQELPYVMHLTVYIYEVPQSSGTTTYRVFVPAPNVSSEYGKNGVSAYTVDLTNVCANYKKNGNYDSLCGKITYMLGNEHIENKIKTFENATTNSTFYNSNGDSVTDGNGYVSLNISKSNKDVIYQITEIGLPSDDISSISVDIPIDDSEGRSISKTFTVIVSDYDYEIIPSQNTIYGYKNKKGTIDYTPSNFNVTLRVDSVKYQYVDGVWKNGNNERNLTLTYCKYEDGNPIADTLTTYDGSIDYSKLSLMNGDVLYFTMYDNDQTADFEDVPCIINESTYIVDLDNTSATYKFGNNTTNLCSNITCKYGTADVMVASSVNSTAVCLMFDKMGNKITDITPSIYYSISNLTFSITGIYTEGVNTENIGTLVVPIPIEVKENDSVLYSTTKLFTIIISDYDYEIVSSHNQIHASYNANNEIIYNPSTLNVKLKVDGIEYTYSSDNWMNNDVSRNLSLEYKVEHEDGKISDYVTSNGTISTDKLELSNGDIVWLRMWDDGKVADFEDIPVIFDGRAGENSVSVLLDNPTHQFTSGENATTELNLHLFDGHTEVKSFSGTRYYVQVSGTNDAHVSIDKKQKDENSYIQENTFTITYTYDGKDASNGNFVFNVFEDVNGTKTKIGMATFSYYFENKPVGINKVDTFYAKHTSETLTLLPEVIESIKLSLTTDNAYNSATNFTVNVYDDINITWYINTQQLSLSSGDYLLSLDVTVGDNNKILSVAQPHMVTRYITDGTSGGTIYKIYDYYACVSNGANPKYDESDNTTEKFYAPYHFEWSGSGSASSGQYPREFDLDGWNGEDGSFQIVNDKSDLFEINDKQKWTSNEDSLAADEIFKYVMHMQVLIYSIPQGEGLDEKFKAFVSGPRVSSEYGKNGVSSYTVDLSNICASWLIGSTKYDNLKGNITFLYGNEQISVNHFYDENNKEAALPTTFKIFDKTGKEWEKDNYKGCEVKIHVWTGSGETPQPSFDINSITIPNDKHSDVASIAVDIPVYGEGYGTKKVFTIIASENEYEIVPSYNQIYGLHGGGYSPSSFSVKLKKDGVEYTYNTADNTWKNGSTTSSLNLTYCIDRNGQHYIERALTYTGAINYTNIPYGNATATDNLKEGDRLWLTMYDGNNVVDFEDIPLVIGGHDGTDAYTIDLTNQSANWNKGTNYGSLGGKIIAKKGINDIEVCTYNGTASFTLYKSDGTTLPNNNSYVNVSINSSKQYSVTGIDINKSELASLSYMSIGYPISISDGDLNYTITKNQTIRVSEIDYNVVPVQNQICIITTDSGTRNYYPQNMKCFVTKDNIRYDAVGDGNDCKWTNKQNTTNTDTLPIWVQYAIIRNDEELILTENGSRIGYSKENGVPLKDINGILKQKGTELQSGDAIRLYMLLNVNGENVVELDYEDVPVIISGRDGINGKDTYTIDLGNASQSYKFGGTLQHLKSNIYCFKGSESVTCSPYYWKLEDNSTPQRCVNFKLYDKDGKDITPTNADGEIKQQTGATYKEERKLPNRIGVLIWGGEQSLRINEIEIEDDLKKKVDLIIAYIPITIGDKTFTKEYRISIGREYEINPSVESVQFNTNDKTYTPSTLRMSVSNGGVGLITEVDNLTLYYYPLVDSESLPNEYDKLTTLTSEEAKIWSSIDGSAQTINQIEGITDARILYFVLWNNNLGRVEDEEDIQIIYGGKNGDPGATSVMYSLSNSNNTFSIDAQQVTSTKFKIQNGNTYVKGTKVKWTSLEDTCLKICKDNACLSPITETTSDTEIYIQYTPPTDKTKVVAGSIIFSAYSNDTTKIEGSDVVFSYSFYNLPAGVKLVDTWYKLFNSDNIYFTDDEIAAIKNGKLNDKDTSYANIKGWTGTAASLNVTPTQQYLYSFDITRSDDGNKIIGISQPRWVTKYTENGKNGGTLYKIYDYYACVSNSENPRFNENDPANYYYYYGYKFTWEDGRTEEVYPTEFSIADMTNFQIQNTKPAPWGQTYGNGSQQQWTTNEDSLATNETLRYIMHMQVLIYTVPEGGYKAFVVSPVVSSEYAHLGVDAYTIDLSNASNTWKFGKGYDNLCGKITYKLGNKDVSILSYYKDDGKETPMETTFALYDKNNNKITATENSSVKIRVYSTDKIYQVREIVIADAHKDEVASIVVDIPVLSNDAFNITKNFTIIISPNDYEVMPYYSQVYLLDNTYSPDKLMVDISIDGKQYERTLDTENETWLLKNTPNVTRNDVKVVYYLKRGNDTSIQCAYTHKGCSTTGYKINGVTTNAGVGDRIWVELRKTDNTVLDFEDIPVILGGRNGTDAINIPQYEITTNVDTVYKYWSYGRLYLSDNTVSITKAIKTEGNTTSNMTSVWYSTNNKSTWARGTTYTIPANYEDIVNFNSLSFGIKENDSDSDFKITKDVIIVYNNQKQVAENILLNSDFGKSGNTNTNISNWETLE